MARITRQISSTGVYHIVLRGIEKKDIFIDPQDKRKIMEELKRTKEKYKYSIFAYCLMSNHIHLLVKDNEDNISKAIQSFAVAYSIYFNKKYDRVGHLFQNRFNSRCVEDETYLLNVQRYIHRNPEKAKIAKTEDYNWSSYKEYLYGGDLTDTSFILSIFGKNEIGAKKAFKEFNTTLKQEEMNDFVEYEIISKLTDEELKNIIEATLKINDVNDIIKYNTSIRNEMLKKLKGIRGTSASQIGRIIGLNNKTIKNIIG